MENLYVNAEVDGRTDEMFSEGVPEGYEPGGAVRKDEIPEEGRVKKGLNEEEQGAGQIFDDIFKTMLSRIPGQFIPLINKVFGTEYPCDAEVVQLKSEYVTENGKRIADTAVALDSFRIGKEQYHIECQSRPDGKIAVRMVEYGFLMALGNRKEAEGMMEIRFPRSCVLYLRNTRNTPDRERVRIVFQDGQKVVYSIPVIKSQKYSLEEILEKRLYVLLPYYIMRYEKEYSEIEKDKKKTEELQEEFGRMLERVHETEAESVYSYLMDYISRINGYMLRNNQKLKERMGNYMGGKIIRTRTDDILDQGRKEGRAEGRAEERKNTLRERSRAEAAEKEVRELKEKLMRLQTAGSK